MQDLPGVLIGSTAERSGVAMRLMELYKRLSIVKFPKISIVIRKAFGFGLIVMGSASMGMDYISAWPNAQIGFMAANNAAEVLYRKQLAEVREKEGIDAGNELLPKFECEIARDNAPWTAAGRAYIHNVIKPEETRQANFNELFLAEGYRKNKYYKV